MQLLDFEAEIAPVEEEIESLRLSEETADRKDAVELLRALKKKHAAAVKKTYAGLNGWQTCQVARHPQRPQFLDYARRMCEQFTELHGDRNYADDGAIVAGLAFFESRPVAVIGQQKGAGTAERLRRNFGMAGPEGYRKALRIMNLAEKFRLPVLAFVDTPGAYPGIGAEERGQSGAIGMCLQRAAVLQTPFLSAIIGEGGSGGALALAAGDYVGMLRYSVYSVISPEGCASILWKDAKRMADAAELLHMTAPRLKKLRVIDEVIDEPPGGAHRNAEKVIESVRTAFAAALDKFDCMEPEALLQERRRRWRNYGKFQEAKI